MPPITIQITTEGSRRLREKLAELLQENIELQLMVEQLMPPATAEGSDLTKMAEQAVERAKQVAQAASQPTPLEGRRKAAEGS